MGESIEELRLSAKINTIAFFPWMALKESIVLGEYTLVPVDLTQNPGISPDEWKDVTNVLSYYKYTKRHTIRHATLVKVGDRPFNALLNEQDRIDLFKVAEIVAFVGLAGRQYFSHWGYCNTDNFRLIVQNFKDSECPPSTVTRRRDGSNTTAYADDMFEEVAPPHVSVIDSLELDLNLLGCLFDSFRCDFTEWPRWFDGICSFNRANTDSDLLRETQEMVSICGAIERFVGSSTGKEREFVQGIENRIQATELAETSASARKWKTRYQSSPTIVNAWAKDFFRLRGDLAHGKGVELNRTIWHLGEHLLLAAFISPILLKVDMEEFERYDLTELDKASLKCFPELLALDDTFARADKRDPNSFRWRDVFNKCKDKYDLAKIVEDLQAGKFG